VRFRHFFLPFGAPKDPAPDSRIIDVAAGTASETPSEQEAGNEVASGRSILGRTVGSMLPESLSIAAYIEAQGNESSRPKPSSDDSRDFDESISNKPLRSGRRKLGKVLHPKVASRLTSKTAASTNQT